MKKRTYLAIVAGEVVFAGLVLFALCSILNIGFGGIFSGHLNLNVFIYLSIVAAAILMVLSVRSSERRSHENRPNIFFGIIIAALAGLLLLWLLRNVTPAAPIIAVAAAVILFSLFYLDEKAVEEGEKQQR